MVTVPFIEPEELERHANTFLEKYHPSKTPPVPIETIVEFGMGLRVESMRDLEAEYEISGFAMVGGEGIVVDQREMMTQEYRYRFTLAHEVGHLILHMPIYEEANVTDLESYLDFEESMTQTNINDLEFQARSFAGRVLVPYGAVLEAATTTYQAVAPEIKGKGFTKRQLASGLARKIYKQFEVTEKVVETRLFGDKLIDDVIVNAERRTAG